MAGKRISPPQMLPFVQSVWFWLQIARMCKPLTKTGIRSFGSPKL